LPFLVEEEVPGPEVKDLEQGPVESKGFRQELGGVGILSKKKVRLDWFSLGLVRLGWVWLVWVRLGWDVWLGLVGVWFGLGWVGLGWVGLG